MADNYRVTGQQEVMDLSGPGLGVRAIEVTFTTLPSEITGTVRVPLANYSAESVHRAIDDYTRKLEAVQGL